MREQQWVKIKLYLPDGVTAVGVSEVEMPLNNLYLSCAEKEFELNTESFMYGRLELIVDVSLNWKAFKWTCKNGIAWSVSAMLVKATKGVVKTWKKKTEKIHFGMPSLRVKRD